MTYSRRIVAAVCVVGALLAGATLAWGQQSKVSEDPVPEFWRKIQNATATSDDSDLLNYWGEVSAVCFTAFNELEQAKDWRSQVRFFVDQFGRHGPQADFRWLITQPRLTVPVPAVAPNYGTDERPSRRADVADAMCEAIVRRALADPEFLSRYYRAVFWTEEFFGRRTKDGPELQSTYLGSAVSSTRTGFAKRPSVEYWWWARNAVLLFHATGRNDLLKDVIPCQLKGRFEQFDKWLDTNWPYLRADPKYPRWILADEAKRHGQKWKDEQGIQPVSWPAKPFADWKGTAPPPVRLIHIIY